MEPCEVCGEPINPDGWGRSRWDVKYCSNACKQKAYRRRNALPAPPACECWECDAARRNKKAIPHRIQRLPLERTRGV